MTFWKEYIFRQPLKNRKLIIYYPNADVIMGIDNLFSKNCPLIFHSPPSRVYPFNKLQTLKFSLSSPVVNFDSGSTKIIWTQQKNTLPFRIAIGRRINAHHFRIWFWTTKLYPFLFRIILCVCCHIDSYVYDFSTSVEFFKDHWVLYFMNFKMEGFFFLFLFFWIYVILIRGSENDS